MGGPESGPLFLRDVMATKSNETRTATIREAHRRLRLAVRECKVLLARTEEMIRRAQQDNDPPRR